MNHRSYHHHNVKVKLSMDMLQQCIQLSRVNSVQQIKQTSYTVSSVTLVTQRFLAF